MNTFIIFLLIFAQLHTSSLAGKLSDYPSNPLLTCIGIRYSDKKQYTSSSRCKTIARNVSEFYRRNSRGKLNIRTAGYLCGAPYKGTKKNVYKAEKYCINQYNKKKGKSDMYIAILQYLGFSHAGNRVAHVNRPISATAIHEVGHLIGLQHAGKYDKKGVYRQYEDRASAMSRYPSAWLTAPQYHHMGWLNPEEVMQYTPAVVTYNLRRITQFTQSGNATIIIPRPQRNVYVSFPPKCPRCIALHFRTGGGSQLYKIVPFNKPFTDKKRTQLTFTPVDVGVVNITSAYHV